MRIHPMVLVVALALLPAGPAAAERTAEWVARMDGLAVTLGSLLTEAQAPLDDERRARLKRDVATLRTLTHGLSMMSAVPDTDPTIPLLLKELDAAIDGMDRAQPDRVGDAALAVAWTCMGCHTRAGFGTPRPIASLAPVSKDLPPDVRGTALAATRRFVEARAAFRQAAYDEELARKEPVRWERSVKGALLLDLRIHHDAKSALDVVDQVLATPEGDALWAEAAAWRKVLVPMAREQSLGPEKPRTLASLEAEATRLMADAEARGPSDAGAEILYLRATAVVHELLMKNPPKDMKAQALAWLGRSYRALKDLDVWSLHLVYDAACVEAAPHSPIARECYARWRDGARAAFTGNGGGPLPPDLAAVDVRLGALAGP